MTARKMNCSTECPLDGTPRATLRGLLNSWREIRLPGLDRPVQYGTRTSTEPVQDRKNTEQGMTEEDRYCGHRRRNH
jgi:hypothetical protein